MDDVLRTALENLSIQIKEEDATITYDPLPVITVDITQMVRVMQNLISNAIKFHGEKAPEVHISCKDLGNEFQFFVKDNGIGIDPIYKDKIFILFQRLHARDKYEGTGIGLAITKKIVERHGGNIWFDSEVDKGSTFIFTLPKRSLK